MRLKRDLVKILSNVWFSTIVSGTVAISITEYYDYQREGRQNKNYFNDKHKNYSKSMSEIYAFKQKYNDDYINVFCDGMLSEKEIDRKEIININKCRIITRDYWNTHQELIDKYPNHLSYDDKVTLEKRKKRFDDLVLPLQERFESRTTQYVPYQTGLPHKKRNYLNLFSPFY